VRSKSLSTPLLSAQVDSRCLRLISPCATPWCQSKAWPVRQSRKIRERRVKGRSQRTSYSLPKRSPEILWSECDNWPMHLREIHISDACQGMGRSRFKHGQSSSCYGVFSAVGFVCALTPCCNYCTRIGYLWAQCFIRMNSTRSRWWHGGKHSNLMFAKFE